MLSRKTRLVDWLISRPDGIEEGNVVGNFLDQWQKTLAPVEAEVRDGGRDRPRRLTGIAEGDRPCSIRPSIRAAPDLIDPDGPEAARRLRAQCAEIAQLAGGLAHEIRNPLSTMRLNLDLLAEDFAEPETTRDRRVLQKIDRLRKESHRLEDILEDFLRFVRVQELRRVPTDLNAVVDDMRDFCEGQSLEQGITTRVHYDPDLPPIPLDADLFKQALLNLIRNAQIAMPDGGELILQTRGEGPWAVLDVIDTGCGIPADVQPRSSSRSSPTRPKGQRPRPADHPPDRRGPRRRRSTWRARSARARSSPSGCRSARRRRSVDGLMAMDTADPRPGRRRRRAARPGRRREPGARRLRCTVAGSGREGLRLIEEQEFDVVLTDLLMDDVGGMEVLAKAKRELPEAEVVILTGHNMAKAAVAAMQAGAATYLTKPLDINELRTVVDKRSQSRRLARSNAELQRQLNERFGFEGVIGNSLGHARRRRPAPPDRPDLRHRAHHRRERHRQGAGRQRPPHQQPPAAASRSSP